jgi:uncharacterized OB-fold protein
MKIYTAEEFKLAVGREPEADDLERVNCPNAGRVGHYSCGWCEKCDKPYFECIHLKKEFL